MTIPENGEPQERAPAAEPPSADGGTPAGGAPALGWLKLSRRRRRLAIAAGITGVVLALAIFVLPTYAARWLVDSALDDLGLEASGVQTVEFDLWNREIWFGPVTIGVPGAEPAKIGRFGLSFSAAQLFKRRGLGKDVQAAGVEIAVDRGPGGQISINGIDLSKLGQPGNASAGQEDGEPWGVGLNSLTLRDSRVRFTAADGGELVVKIDRLHLGGFRTWTPEAPGRFAVAATVNDIGLNVDGEATPFADRIDIQATSEISAVELAKIERFTGPLGLARGDGTLSAKLTHNASFTPDGAIEADSSGRITLDGIALALPGGPAVSFDRAEATLDAVRASLPGGGGPLTGGRLRGGSISVDVAGLATRLDGDGDRPAASLGARSLRFDGSRFEAKLAKNEPASWRLSYTGEAGGLTAEIGGPQPGTLAIDDLKVTDGAIDSDLQARAGKLTIGQAKMGSTGSSPGTLRLAAIELTGLALAGTTEGSLERLRLAQIDAESANGAGQKISLRIDAVDAQGAKLGALTAPQGPDIAVAAASVKDLQVLVPGDDALDLRLGTLSLNGVRRNGATSFGIESGSLAGLAITASSALLAFRNAAASETPADAPEAGRDTATAGAGSQAASLPKLSIGQFDLEDQAHITVTDKRQSPPVKLETTVDALQLRGLDTADPASQATFVLAATINEFTKVKADGWLNPADKKLDFKLTAAIDNLELPTFSPYAAKQLGVNLETGRLTAGADGQVVGGDLNITTKLDILNLKFSPLNAEDAARLQAAVGVPAETAVGLLQDSDGRIELTIPVKGNLENPDFQLDQVVNKAVGNAIKGAIGTTLKVIFPPVLLISVVSSVAEEATGIKFAPAPFEPGTTDLLPQGRQLVDALGTLLSERPKLGVTLCGRSTAADLRAVLAPDIVDVQGQRRAAYEQAVTAYRAAVEPFVAQGIVDETGKVLVDNPPQNLPQMPEQPVLAVDAIAEQLAAARGNELRDRLTALASERTRIMRQALEKRGDIAGDRVGECRPVYDPKDNGPPRAIVNL